MAKRMRDRLGKVAPPTQKKKGPVKGTKKSGGQTTKKSTTKRAPKAVQGKKRAADTTLPGMDDFDRDHVLSKCAGKVADERFTRSESELREADWMVIAHKRMKEKDLFTYSAHGVDFIRTPGEETFKAKWKKEDGNKSAKETARQSKTEPADAAPDQSHDVESSDGGPLPAQDSEDFSGDDDKERTH